MPTYLFDSHIRESVYSFPPRPTRVVTGNGEVGTFDRPLDTYSSANACLFGGGAPGGRSPAW